MEHTQVKNYYKVVLDACEDKVKLTRSGCTRCSKSYTSCRVPFVDYTW